MNLLHQKEYVFCYAMGTHNIDALTIGLFNGLLYTVCGLLGAGGGIDLMVALFKWTRWMCLL